MSATETTRSTLHARTLTQTHPRTHTHAHTHNHTHKQHTHTHKTALPTKGMGEGRHECRIGVEARGLAKLTATVIFSFVKLPAGDAVIVVT